MTDNPNFTPIRQSLLEKIEAGQLPSMAVAVTQRGKILWNEALGWADRERRVPASPATLYPVASVSKSITATGLMVLAERGQVDLDAPLTRYVAPGAFPASPYPLEQATVRQVVNMVGAIPHLWKFDYADQPETARSTTELVQRHGFLAMPPGKSHFYSNLAYGVIELVIAQAAGRPFADFMRDELFAPLGMADTALKDGLRTDAPHSYAALSTAYDAENRPVPWSFRLRPDGAAGFYSTSRDLLRYCLFHLNNPLEGMKAPLTAAAVDALHRTPDPQAPNYRINPIAHYAMGWGIVEDGLYTSLWSNGAMLGCSAMLLLVPAEGVGVACLSNYTSPDSISDQTAIEIAGALLPGFAENLQTHMGQVEETERQAQPDRGLYGAWRGVIALPGGKIPLACVLSQPNAVKIRLGSQPEISLEEARLARNALEGRAACALPLEETFNQAHTLVFELRLDAGRLTGIVRAESSGERPHFGLPFYVELDRTDRA